MNVPLCGTCGQPLPTTGDLCATPGCNHALAEHNITKGRKRAECSRFTARGRCPCRKYTPAEAADG